MGNGAGLSKVLPNWFLPVLLKVKWIAIKLFQMINELVVFGTQYPAPNVNPILIMWLSHFYGIGKKIMFSTSRR